MNRLLESYFNVKRDLKELEYQENYLKQKIHTMLDNHQTDIMESPQYKITRTWRQRESIERAHVPANIWNEYKNVSEFPVLHLKPQ